ncbi:hypothetical protein MCOR31_006993 [Pyricularia oryzae]|nr:hypothetical protein MCOR28_008552 [Pyricularia oryzae]KAI6345651.1 hypothetical protein MCOR30_000826 [Pyricularia oryzae]KAI6365352.1 hypothetical protein MCOR31_006993 [Pyricularia oryzae]KAI6403144.1 hypothetical protein MCOR20_007422 [Pyricularia oryzae]KAI6429673.1 hypothetical protein MCOR24_002056 [Pyricularia oryzae]
MYFNPLILSTALVSFCAFVHAHTPELIYRGESRNPREIKATGGFLARGGLFGVPKDDNLSYGKLWVSRAWSQYQTYVYYINTDLINTEIVDVAAAYQNDNLVYPCPHQQEFMVRDRIPWAAIVGWDIMQHGTVISHGLPGSEDYVKYTNPAPRPRVRRTVSSSTTYDTPGHPTTNVCHWIR